MPTYAYRCGSCGYEFDRFQSITAEPVKVCPQCGRAKARRLIGTGAAILFKGSGFYATDYRSKTYADAAKAEKPAAPTPSPAGEGNGSSGGNKGAAGPSGSSDGKPSASTNRDGSTR
jgi:putative FmdB family regulatory protein